MIAALAARSRLHAALGQKAEAKADLDAADLAARSRPDERLLIGQIYARQGYDKEAIAEFDQWIPAHPKNDQLAAALNDRCWSRALLGVDLDKALSDCNAAVKLSSGSPVMFTSRGLVRYRMGDLDGAIADYDASLKVTNAAWPLYGRGLARLKKGLSADGQADLRQAATLAPHIAQDAASHGLTP
jgi:tetratricopeptide (TPR) repeat protein